MKQVIGMVMLLAVVSVQAQPNVDYSYYNEYLQETETMLQEHIKSMSREEIYELEGYLLDAQFNSRMSLLTGFMFVDDVHRALDE